MACSVYRDKDGDITRVEAHNGKESVLYNSLLQSFGPEGEQQALRAWASVYTPSWKSEHGDWESFAKAKELGDSIEGVYKALFKQNPEQTLHEFAMQANSSDKEKEGAIITAGKELISLAQKIFPNARNGDVYKSMFDNRLDSNGEPLASQVKLDEFNQIHGTEGSIASPLTLSKVKEFLERIDVKVNEFQDITVDGTKLGANGVARILAGIIDIAKGKTDIALPEEAMHFAVELIQQKYPTLYNSMLNKIGQYNLYSKTLEDYKDVYKNEKGLPDIPKIKKEAMARVLVESIINKNEGTIESRERLLQTKGWWDKFVEWFKGLFSKAGFNPFEQTAEKILAGKEELGSAEDLQKDETYYQKKEDLVNKLHEEEIKIGKDTTGKYTRLGTQVKRTVTNMIEKFYDDKRRNKNITEDDAQKAAREYKEATAGKGATDIDNILHRYIGDDNKLRSDILAPDQPSALMPKNRSYYNTLEKNIAERLNSYPGGTQFFHNLNVYDQKSGILGNINLLAITPTGKVDILQFKFPNIRNKAGILSTYEQTAFNMEVEALRKILQDGYGVDKKDFNLTRAIPVRAYYSYIDRDNPAKGTKLSNLKIGSVDVTAEKDESLLPIASSSESTGSKELDGLLYKLRGLLDKLQDEKVTPSQANEKGNRISSLLGAIRKLQVQKDSSKVIENSQVLVKRAEGIRAALTQQVEKADPSQMSIAQINKLSADILDAKDNLLAYKDLDIVMERIYSSPDEKQQKFIADSGDVARRASRLIRDLEDLEDRTRTDIFANKMSIKDELNPEKALTWYRRMIRSLSQSSTKAGAELWSLVKRINNKLQIRFDERMKVLAEHAKGVNEWSKSNGGMKAVYSKIFSFDEKGRWQGRFISRTDKGFYTELETRKDKKDHNWIKDNIDMDGYKKWFNEELSRRTEASKTLRLDPDDERNEIMVKKSLDDFVTNYDIDKKTVANKYNYVLNGFPRSDKWRSKEFTELNKVENKPLLDLYNYWQDVLEKSHNAGLIASWERRTFFPNVRTEYLEKSLYKIGPILGAFIDNIRIENEDTTFGKQDPLTGEPIDNVHAAYVYDLGKEAKDSDDNRFIDYSEKSMDLFRVMALWEKELIRYNLRTESESIAKLIASTEGRKKALAVNRVGNIVKDKGQPLQIDNIVNTKYIKDFIDATYYGKKLESGADLTFSIPYGSAVEKINKLLGKEVFPVPEEKSVQVSGIKALQTFNRYFAAKTLGLNPLTAIAHMFGGVTNTYINTGKFFTKTDLLAAQSKLVSGRFYDAQGKIQAGLIDYFIPFLEDRTEAKARDLSVNNAVKYLSSEHLMTMLRTADKGVQYPVFLAFAQNTTIREGKLVNIRDLVKQEEGYAGIYNLPYEEQSGRRAEIEKKIEEIKKNESLFQLAKIEGDKLVLPGIDRDSDTVADFRQRVQEFTKEALGNVTHEDLSLYKRSVMMQSFFMFKNWIPRMVDTRGQSLKYNPGTDSYEWGRARMLYRALQTNGLSTIGSLLKQLSGNDKDIISIAKKLYTEKQEVFASQNEEFNMSEADFIDSYVKGVRSEFKELALAASLLGILVFARVHAPDKDDDPQIKGMYKWSLRAIDKLTDRLNFFYDPASFTNIANGSVFPAVSLLTDAQTLFKDGLKDAYYWSTGDQEGFKKVHAAKYFFKSVPIAKQVVDYTAIFNHDFAKDMGIQISSQAAGK